MRTNLTPILAALALGAPVAAQQFQRNLTQIPGGSIGYCEQVDFADVDLDGDWDAAFACGGDIGNLQNRLWINRGASQGGPIGTFADETGVRLPAITDSSRDVEFADWDADGDVDLFISNHCDISNQPSRFWTNQGGIQGPSAGVFVDETATRWIGLGGAGSSIPAVHVLPGGGYVNWPWDSDFADFDNDGDLDLVHSSAGGVQSGQNPTRIFLNDGTGHFTEFNPSGFQLTGTNIANNNPGLWCEGLQQSNTLNNTGQFCDIADQVISVDPGDLDQDYDLDLVWTPQGERPRAFQNRLAETGGLAFRDATTLYFMPGYSTGNGHYEETLQDFDDDGDLDLYGINWLVSGLFHDAVLLNLGSSFGAPAIVPSSGDDDEDADGIDYDLDGDVDVFVSNFSGQDRMYRNTAGTMALATGVLPADTTTTKDADSADVDADGDPDLFVANDANQVPWFLVNTTSANDVSAPRVARLEQALDRVPGVDPTIVRAQVYDNASYTMTWYDVVQIEQRENTDPAFTLPMRASMGQVFRGAIPGQLRGLISYRVLAADEHGNSGASPLQVFASGVTGSGFCFGDGTGTACPCGNSSPVGAQAGCASSLGVGARLVASGTASVASDTLLLAAGPLPDSPGLFFQGTARVNSGAGATFGDGLRCVGGSVIRLGIKLVSGGVAAYPEPGDTRIAIRGQIAPAGGTRHYQLWYRNAASFCTGDTFNLTNGWTVAWAP